LAGSDGGRLEGDLIIGLVIIRRISPPKLASNASPTSRDLPFRQRLHWRLLRGLPFVVFSDFMVLDEFPQRFSTTIACFPRFFSFRQTSFELVDLLTGSA